MLTSFARTVVARWRLGAHRVFRLSQQLFRWEPEAKVPRSAKLWAASTVIPFLLLGIWENRTGHLSRERASRLSRRRTMRRIQRTELPRKQNPRSTSAAMRSFARHPAQLSAPYWFLLLAQPRDSD